MTKKRSPRRTQALLDRTAIHATLETYLSSLDRRDWTAYGACFTQDARVEFDHGKPELVIGRSAIVKRAEQRRDRPISNHLLSNAFIEIDGDRAKAHSNCIAHLLVVGRKAPRIVVRGLEYDDDLLADSGRVWRISRRSHRALWQFEAPAAPLGY